MILAYCCLCLLASRRSTVFGFDVRPLPTKFHHFRSPPLSSTAVDELSNERKALLFEALLRDLQIENVPLLDCDADQVHTLQAAVWTTMAELSAQPDEGKACLILENIPMGALQTWIDDFLMLKTQKDQIDFLPEIDRLSVSLLGKGVGPAILLEVANGATTKPSREYNEFACSAAMKLFGERVVIGNSEPDSMSLGDEGSAAPIEYRFAGTNDACATLATFWNCVCEMLTSDKAGTLCLQIPNFSSDFQRFNAVTELMGRTLCLYEGDSFLSLVHFHPLYDRSLVTTVDKPAFGHLPPVSWMKPMLKSYGVDDDMNEENLSLCNFQRKSPIASVNIVRNSLLSDPSIVELELDNGSKVQASGLEVYCKNALKLAELGTKTLQNAHNSEVDVIGQ